MPIRPLCVLLSACLAAGCGSDPFTTPTAPSTPATTVTELFEGTLTVNGAATYPFTVAQPGTATASLTALSPDSSVVVGLSLGTWNGSACQIILANDAASQGASVVGNATSIGSFCARIYDVGKLTAATDFVVTLTHY
jgi:hypothetical protein